MKNEVIGYITHFSPERVKGFAFDAESTDELKVDLLVNGAFVSSQQTDQPMQMLEKQGIAGRHGFHFDLKNLGAFHQNDNVEVRVNDQALPMAPNLRLQLYKHGQISRKPGPLYFFMHIPKTAGTSFRFMLYKAFEQNVIWPNKEVLAQNGKRYPAIPVLRELDQELLQTKNLVMGHYPLWSLKYFPKRPEVVTFLRKPADQYLSLANHKRTRLKDLSEKPLVDILEEDVMYNPQTYFFLPSSVPTDNISQQEFEIAVRNLRSCAFVGIKEKFDVGMDCLERLFGWQLGKRMKKNVGASQSLSSKEMEIIERKTYWDRKLYEEAVVVFDQILNTK